jgi:glycosyltransferase involved in cell wall biosynthesis
MRAEPARPMNPSTNSRGVVFVAPVLPTDVVATARALHTQGWLDRLVTRTALSPALARAFAGVSFLRPFSRRPISPLPSRHVVQDRTADLIGALHYRRSKSRIKATDASFAHVDRCASRLITSTTAAVLAREDACLKAFEAARRHGAKSVYQLPTAFVTAVQMILAREHKQFPNVAVADEEQDAFLPERLQRKHAELAAADVVLCPSTFVARTLPQALGKQKSCVTVPFGVEQAWLRPGAPQRENMFLYAGRISVRKGAHRLLHAWKKLGAYRTHKLVLIGELALSESFLRDHRDVFEHVPRIAREQLPAYYERAQAFVFNSPADGFGNVILEAMACSTPVLASRNSGAPDVFDDGVDGRLFGFGDDEQFLVTLDWALTHPTELREMGVKAHQRAAANTWERYSERLLSVFAPFMSGRNAEQQ